MLSQQALQIDLSEGEHDVVQLESSQYVGPVDYAWTSRNENDPLVLGVGPLADTPVPGASGLVIAGHSPLWEGFHPTLIEGAGLTLKRMGLSLLVLRGKAPELSVLVVRLGAGRLQVTVEPFAAEEVWKGTHDGEGSGALLCGLAGRYSGELSGVQVLAVGPGAKATSCGGIGAITLAQGQQAPVSEWAGRGGFGSRLYQSHGLCAVVLGYGQPQTTVAAPEQEPFLGRFSPGMSVAELEEALKVDFAPKLVRGGTLGLTFETLRHRALWFNASSVLLSDEQRDDLYRRALRDRLLTPFWQQMRARGQHQPCGEPCALCCRKRIDERLVSFEPYAALGPQLGIADLQAIARVVRRCETLGLEPLSAGGIVAWLMERLHGGQLTPLELGLSRQPRWSVEDFDPAADSQHNAELALELLDGLLQAPWGAAVRQGLRPAAQGSGGDSAALAVYSANGDVGEMIPVPVWSPGFFTPMAIAGEYHHYYGLEFVPPRVLGRKSAQRMAAELMLQNFGICRLHRVWAEELSPDLINRLLGTTTDWAAHHRKLARSIYRRRKARFWETERVIDIIAGFLRGHQHGAAPDAELDRWVRRFREDKPSAARAYWSEVNAGMEEIFGA